MNTAKPIIILSLIVAIISALVIIVYNMTYVDTSGVITAELSEAITEVYGSADGFEVVPADEWRAVLTEEEFPRITKVVRRGSDGVLAFETVVKGYKDGFDILVGVKDGAVVAVSIVSTGEETPGLGTKTADPSFLSQFAGISGEAVVVKTEPSADNEVQAVTSATFSSKGVAQAVNMSLAAYEKCGGAF